MKRWIIALTAIGLLAHGAARAAYPDRPITWIVPFAAGGPTDAMARNIANRVSQELGQSIVIENAAGAGGTIGSAKAARAQPDGYTLLVGHVGYMAAAPALYKRLAYDPVKDFEAVFRFPDTPLVLLVGERSPHRSVSDLIAYAKANPGKLNFSNAGVGSTSHLVAAMFAAKAGIDITPIAYKGAGPALNDLMGGQVDAMFDQTNTALPQTRAGKVRALGLTSTQPMPAQFPGVPAIAEQGIPGFEASTWYGLYAPKGTPAEVIDILYAAYRRAMQDKAFTDRMSEQGIQLLPESQYAPQAFQRHTEDEVKRWAEVVKQAGISLD
jgi:Uncharacterized protein conserved in bacteria